MANARTVKSFAVVTVFAVAARFVSFLFKVYVSRAYGAEIIGLYQIALSVLLLLFSFTAGAPTVLSRKVAAAVSRGDFKLANSLTTASLILGAGTSAVLLALCYGLNDKLGFLFSNPKALELFMIMLPALFTSTVYASLRSWFWGRKRFLAFSSTELIDEVFKLFFAFIFAGGAVEAFSGERGIAVAFTLADVLCVVVLAVLFFVAGGRFAKPSGTKGILHATVPLSAMRCFTSLVASLTAYVIPLKLASSGMGIAAATAEYGRVAGMALPLIMAPITLTAALSVVLTPDMATAAAKKDIKTLGDYFETSLVFAALVASAFFALYVPLGKELGQLFFGDANAGRFVSVCAVIIFPMSLYQAVTPMLNSMGLEFRTFWHYIVGALGLLPCIFFLPQYVGVYAMAIGSGVCFSVAGVLHLILLRRKLGKLSGVYKSAGICAFSAPLALLGVLLERLLAARLNYVLVIFVVCAVLIALYCAFIFAFKIVNVKSYLVLLKRKKGANATK